MALTLQSPTITVNVQSQTINRDNTAIQIRSLFPGLSDNDLRSIVTLVSLEGPLEERRTQFSVVQNIGRLSHYELIYIPSNGLLRWRQILATVPIPSVYNVEWGVVKQKWKGFAGKVSGRKKNVFGYKYIPRGLNEAETRQVYQHLLDAVHQFVARQPMALTS